MNSEYVTPSAIDTFLRALDLSLGTGLLKSASSDFLLLLLDRFFLPASISPNNSSVVLVAYLQHSRRLGLLALARAGRPRPLGGRPLGRALLVGVTVTVTNNIYMQQCPFFCAAPTTQEIYPSQQNHPERTLHKKM